MRRSICFLALALSAAGCGKPFQDQRNGVNGAVTLWGELDNSGADVALIESFDNGAPGVDDDIALLVDGMETEIEKPIMHVLTDQSGNYNLKDPPIGNFFLLVTKAGFAPYVRHETLSITNSANGKVTVEEIVLSRVSFSVQGMSFTPGTNTVDGTLQTYTINDRLGVFDLMTGVWNRVPSELPLVGATLAPMGDNALFHTGANSTGAEPNTVVAGKARSPMAVPGGTLPAVTTISTNVREAYIGPDGTHFTIFNPNGNGTNVDIRTGAFSAPETLSLVGSDVSAIEYVSDQMLRGGIFASTVYRQFAFDANPRDILIGTTPVPVRDFVTLDTNTGQTSTVSQVFGAASSFTNQMTGDVFRVFRTVTDNGGMADQDFYFFQPGSMPVKMNSNPLRGNFQLDSATTPGKVYVTFPGSMGESPIYVFDLQPQHNFQLLTTFTGNTTGLTAASRRLGDRLLFLSRGTGNTTNLDALDPKTGAKTTVHAGVTQTGGGAITSIITNTNIARVLGTTALLFNTGSNGGTLGLLVVDTAGAHPIQGTYASQAFTSAAMPPTLSADGGTLLYYDPTATTGGIFSAPIATGAPTGPLANTASTTVPPPTVMGISGNGAIVAYATQVTTVVTPHTVTGGIDTPRTVWNNINSQPANKIVVTQNGLFMSDAFGAGFVTELTNNTFAALTNLTSGPATFTFADGQRMLVSSSASAPTNRWYEVNFNSNLTTTPPNATTVNAILSINSPRNRVFIQTGGNLRALASDGTADTTNGGFQVLQVGGTQIPSSPNGKIFYFMDGAGRVISYGETGPATTLATVMGATQVLPGVPEFAYMDTAMSGVRTLAVLNVETGTRTDVVKGVINTAFQPSAGLGPFMPSDNKSLVAMGDVNAGMAGMKPSLQLAAYNLMTHSTVVLGNNLARSPAPTIDTKRLVRFQGDQDSLTGTFTAYSWPSGGAASTMVATKVRSLTVSNDGMANAVITVDGLKTKLAASMTGSPAVEMGEFNATKVTAGISLVFSGDNSRVYAIAAPANAQSGGDLVAGTVGMPGIRKLAPDVLFANPDKSGRNASVLNLRGARALGIYREP